MSFREPLALLPGIVGTVALMFFSGAFLFWNVDIQAGAVAIFLLSLASLPFLYGGRSAAQFQAVAALFFLAVMAILYAPVRPYSGNILAFALPLTVGLYFLFDPRHLEKTLYIFAAVCALSAASALVVFLLNLVGYDPPHIVLSQNFRRSSGDFYKLYPGSVLLNTQLWQIGSASIVRTSGVFREPGHYAMICSALLICYRYRFSTTIPKFLLLGGLLTFSPAFIAMTIAGIALNLESKQSSRAVWLALSIIFLIALFVQLAPETLLDRLIYNNLAAFSESGLTGVLDQRSHGDIASIYNSLGPTQKFIGIGSSALDTLGLYDIQSSDYRSFVIGYGFLSFISIELFYYWMGSKCITKREGIVVMFFISLLFLHRSWMLSQMWAHLIIISYCIASYHKKKAVQCRSSRLVTTQSDQIVSPKNAR